MDRTELEVLVHTYVDAVGRQDVEACVALFAEDGVQEDPLGTPPNVGHEAIRAFFEKSYAVPFTVEMDPQVLIGGDHASFRFTIKVPLGGDTVVVRVADLMRVDNQGRIAHMQAIQDVG